MKTLNGLHGRSLLAATPGQTIDVPERSGRRIFSLPLAAAVVGLLVGGAALLANGADAYAVPAAGLLGLTLLVVSLYPRRRTSGRVRSSLVLAGLCLGAIVLLLLLPEFLYGGQVNGIIHRSVISGPLLLLLSVLTASHALRLLLGATPTGQDLSLYPLLALPVGLALVAYGLVLGQIVVSGAPGLSLDLLTTAYREELRTQGEAAVFVYEAGLRNNILGTLLLIAMTSLIAILPGVGAGVFMSEYPGRLAGLIDFCTTMLRAVSVFVIGVAAFGLAGLAAGRPAGSLLSDLLRGSYIDGNEFRHAGAGSFLTASVFLSLLVMPIIARLTAEGLRSVPREIREGSVALGATDGHGLRRILLPWAGPNVMTGLLLGAAEASGSLAIIMFIAGTGQHGVGPLSEATSLDFALFATVYGPKSFVDTMGPYQFTAALLLLFLTMGLTALALFLRQRFATRYRGSLVAS